MKALVNYAKNPTPKNKSNLPEQYQTHDAVIALETAFKSFKALEPETSQHPKFTAKNNVLFDTHIDQTFSQDFETRLAELQHYFQFITEGACHTAAEIVKSTHAQAGWHRAMSHTQAAKKRHSVIDSAQQLQKKERRLTTLQTQWKATHTELTNITSLMNRSPDQIAQPSTWMSMKEADKATMYGPFLPMLELFLYAIPTNNMFFKLYSSDFKDIKPTGKPEKIVETKFKKAFDRLQALQTSSEQTQSAADNPAASPDSVTATLLGPAVRGQASSHKDQVAGHVREISQHHEQTTSLSNPKDTPAKPLNTKYGADL